jgi:hypothetical protein
MSFLDKVNQFVLLFVDTLRQFGRWRIWLVLGFYFLLHWLILYGHYEYVRAPFYGLLSPWIHWIAGNHASAFSHYPQHLYYLGRYAGWAKLLVSLLVEGAVLGAVASMFERGFTGESYLAGRRSWPVRWFNLTIAWAVLNGLMLAAGTYLPLLAGPHLTGPRRVLAFSYLVLPGCFALLLGVFFFAIPRVAIFGENCAQALWGSIVMFFHRPFTAFFAAAVILAVPAFLNAMTSRPASIIDRFRPELIYWLLTASLIAEMVSNFFWMGTAVRFLVEPED